jgi:hypothetical protein
MKTGTINSADLGDDWTASHHLDTKAKAPPAWMKREPLSREHTSNALERFAAKRLREGNAHPDRDVREAALHSAGLLARAAKTVLGGEPDWRLTGHLTNVAEAQLACARTTTEPASRATYMDEAHACREAVRHLKGGR